MTAALPQMRDQFRANIDWIEAQLGDGRPWLFGEFSLADVSAYMNVWYARQSLATMDEIMTSFPRVAAWEERIRAIGHSTRTEMSSADALEIAAKARPESPVFGDPTDPNGRKPGDVVAVMPDDYGKIPVRGEIVSLSAQHIAIRRSDERVGEVVVHFPRAGFLVVPG
ncbi:glutathione S-transferase C-terminal domain-containing protein, partial [Bradyrhizobium pachyrhizi]